LFVHLYDIMMAAEASATCRWKVIHDETYFIDVHLLVCYI